MWACEFNFGIIQVYFTLISECVRTILVLNIGEAFFTPYYAFANQTVLSSIGSKYIIITIKDLSYYGNYATRSPSCIKGKCV